MINVNVQIGMAKDNSMECKDVYAGPALLATDGNFLEIPKIGMKINLRRYDICDNENDYISYSCAFGDGGMVFIFIEY